MNALPGEAFLLAMAQIGLAFAGFVSLVSLFPREGTTWLPQEIAGLKLTLEHNLVLVFCGLVPFPLCYVFRNETTVWRVSSVFFAAALLAGLVISNRRRRKVPPRKPTLLLWTFFIPASAFFVIQLLNALLWGSLAAYAWGLLWLLVPPCIQFVIFMLFARLPREPERTTTLEPQREAGSLEVKLPRLAADQEILSLHRYYIWADRMRVHFDDVLRSKRASRDELNSRLYMSYWYAGLFVVVEGWQELGLSDQVIDELLASPNVDLLRRYRNGVFHFQKEYYDERFLGLIRDGENVVEWIRKLNTELGRCLLKKVQQQAK